MSLRNTVVCLTALVVLALATEQAMAQREIHHIPPFIDTDGRNPDLLLPFVDGAFVQDYQFFAPPEFGEFGTGPAPPIGWFATADRIHIRMSRPRQELTSSEGDWTWGNRFAVGYMSGGGCRGSFFVCRCCWWRLGR